MTNGEYIKQFLQSLLERDPAEMLLQAARSDYLNPSGDLYALWCDGCGSCEDEGCSESAQLECIRRFLVRERQK